MVLDLAQLVDRKVHDQLFEMNSRLESLVAEAVDRELDRLVRDLVEANLEGRVNSGDPLAKQRCRPSPRIGDASRRTLEDHP